MDDLTMKQRYRVGWVADALESSARIGSLMMAQHVLDSLMRNDGVATGKRIWSEGFKEYVRRQCPPPPVPWWTRIWSFFTPPSPDGKPGGPWR